MQARLQAVSGGEARLSIATITGKALRMSDVGEARKAKMTEKRATTAERRRTPQRAQTPKPRARNATEAANELEADVAVAYVAASHAALTALARADEDAYAFGCENTYRLQLVETPRRPFGDEAPPLRAQFRGLARVRRGFFARRRVLLGQLGQAKELLGLHRAELRALNLKRSRNAVARLLLMDELYYATDGADAAGAMRLVRASPAGLKAWRALLEVLAAPRGAGDLCGTRNELRDVAARGDSFGDEADDVRSMSDVPEARPTTASAVGGDAAAAQHLASWDALEALFRPEGGGEKREWCEVYRVETFLEDAAVGASVKDDARDAVAAFQLDPNGDAAGDGYPLHRLDAVNAALWDSMGKRFLHVFERSPLADDLLWSLRIARQAARRRPDDDGGADRKAAAAVRRDLMRERGGAVEEATSDGGVRTFAHDADYMDSTALHGVDSRVKLNVLEPLLRLQMGAALELRWTLSAEVAVQTQFIYEMAAPHVQRLARGVLARGFGGGYLEKLRARRILRGAFSAAVVVQGLYRRRRAYVSLLWARFSRFEDAATVLQCLVRAYFSRLAAVALKAARLEKRFIRALTRLQTFQRQRCALKAAKQRRRYLDVTTANAATTWAATAMQAQARAWLGRLATFRRRVELDVNQRILHLAHRYLKSGDLWSFVRAVDDDYRRFEEDARESQRREDEESHTFMKRVLQARDEDHAQAWKSFVDAGSVGGSAVSPKESLLPGPRLRLLLGGLSKSISDSESVPSKRTISTQRASYATARVGKADGDLNRILPGRPPASIARSVRHHHFSTDDASVKRPKDDASLPSALTAPTAGPVLRLADGHHPGRAMHPVSPRLDRAKPAGLTALLDVPKGLDDSLERLLCAAALRAYVPDAFPKGTLVKTAFEQYQALPPSLVKCRHEMEASAGAAPWVAALTAAGFRLIQDLLPQRRLRATLEALAPYVADAFRAAEEERQARVRYVVSFSRAPIKLKAICLAAKDLLDDLVDAKRQAGGAPFVFKNRNQVRYEKLVRDGMMTHHQVIDALRHQRIAHLPPLAPRAALHPLAKPKPPTLLLDSVLESSESVLESLESVAPEMASARSLVTIEEAAATSAKLPDRVQDDLAAQRLQEQFEASVLDDVRKLGGLKCPVDVFGCRAAFLAAELQPLGEFAADVLRCDAARARILVRDRTRLAMQLAAPLLEFAAENKLEFASDLGSVDLAEADWGNVGEQARQLLRSLANTNSAQLVDFEPRKSFEIGRKQDQFLKREAHFFKSEDQTSTFTKPLRARRPPALKQIPFDARFQKSPFDAKGRPARLSLAKTRPDGSKLSRFAAAPLPPSDFERSLPPPVFQKAPESEWVEAIHLLDAKKREVMSLHPDELKPLHLQPQKFVGQAHRSRQIAQKIHVRATSKFSQRGTSVDMGNPSQLRRLVGGTRERSGDDADGALKARKTGTPSSSTRRKSAATRRIRRTTLLRRSAARGAVRTRRRRLKRPSAAF
ncbi:hypothetical protein M885DRAFT_10109 [Pelagophyceae sp. CCMP2097]|nr:hypothetical protein M885DRAFT_10109 [Pelagophyceae sp. CCMP2097]